MTTLTLCRNSHGLCRHGVGVVNNYEDKTITAQTPTANFEDFTQDLKEQSGEKKYLGVFRYPIAII